jgi:glycosyltransferase involved in cell wall biosynthesis
MIDPMQPDYANTPVSAHRPRFDYLPDAPSDPSVTIVTPFYDTGAIFHDTARSVFQQSLQQWEWIIVNDGSTKPEALAVLQEYRHLDPRIRIIDHRRNKGLSAARNTGYDAARTPYVLQLDSDDLLEPTAMEKWLWFLESFPDCAFVKGFNVGFDAQQYLWQQGFHDGEAFLERNLVDPTALVRKTVHRDVGGYDETNRDGLEDWDFWLRCADAGHWGHTVPEYLDWYRRRPVHTDRWTNWDNGEREQAFKKSLRSRYPRLWSGKFPHRLQRPADGDSLQSPPPCRNRLKKRKPRLLVLAPWLTLGGADQFNLQLLDQLTHREWEVTIATTLGGDHSRFPEFSAYTPDVFILHHFLHPTHYPRFLAYLIHSRQPDVVMVTHSELGYDLLPYLRARCPEPAYVDFCHIEEEQWRSGGYPRMAVEKQQYFDLHVVCSDHLKQWMVQKGGTAERIRVCYTNVGLVPRPTEPDYRSTIRRQLDVKESVPLLLYAGRICAQKQPHVLTATIKKLAEARSDFAVVVAGDGPELKWLAAFVERHRLSDRIRLLGAVSHARVRELMLAADIFFLPSAWEGIALAMYEAMACGLPVVGADVGGQRELVTSDCGVLVSRDDERIEAQRYAKILEYFMEHPELCRSMGEAGRKQVEMNFRLDQMGDRMEQVLWEARQIRCNQPRPKVWGEQGDRCLRETIESLRARAASEPVWWNQKQAGGERQPLRVQTFFALRRCLLPVYHAMLRRDMQWATLLKDRVKLTLLGWA